jgi:hypothetical protein
MPQSREVAIGDTPRSIVPFRGLKGELALQLVKHYSGEVKQILDLVSKFEHDWPLENPVTITRELCKRRVDEFTAYAKQARGLVAAAPDEAPKDVPDGEPVPKTKAELEAEAEQFERAAARWSVQLNELGDRQYVEIPNPDPAPLGETILHVFPQAMDIAPTGVKQLLALVVIPDADLLAAYKDGAALDALSALGLDLFAEGLIEELMEFAVVAAEVIIDAVEKYKGPAGKLRALYDRALRRTETSSTTTSETEEEPQPAVSRTSSENGSSSSSTSSPAPTGGYGTRSSEASAGESSSATATA